MASKKKKPEAAETTGAPAAVEERPAEATTSEPGPEPESGDGGGQPSDGGTQIDRQEGLPGIGDVVLYWDRDEIVHSAEPSRERAPRPHPAIVTGYEDLDDEKNLLQLTQFHPTTGAVARRHVRYSELPDANHWSWKPREAVTVTVPMTTLVEAVEIVVSKRLESIGETVDGVDVQTKPAPDVELKNQAGEKIDGRTEVPGPAPTTEGAGGNAEA